MLRAVKSIIHHLMKEKKLPSLGFQNVRITRDNEIMYAISTLGTENVVRARPRNIASCRGDAPGAVMVDEIAFIEKSFFEQFLRPLTQVGGRAFTFITTPPHRDSWFQQFLELITEANARGDFHFYFVSHSLVCAECAKHGVSDRCTHQLGYVPRWKSLMTLHAMLALVPANERATYQTEVLGVLSNKSDSYIDSRLVAGLLEARRSPPPLVDRVYVAIDPASHKGSAMGIAAFCVDKRTGQKVFLGAASVSLIRAEQTQCEMVISQFMTRLREVRQLSEARPVILCAPAFLRAPLLTPGHRVQATVLPIIECNNNEVAAHAILVCVQRFQPVHNWVSAEMFKKHITADVGIWTTHETKAVALRQLQTTLINTGELRISDSFFTADSTAFTPRAPVIDAGLALENVWQEICRFRDTDKGQISGTANGTQKDDVGMVRSKFHLLLRSPLSADTGPAVLSRLCSSQSTGWMQSLTTSRADPATVYRCAVCDRQFKNSALGYVHYKSHFGQCFCMSCGVMVARQDWKRHCAIEHDLPQYECQECNNIYVRKDRYDEHLAREHNGPWFDCRRCKKRYRTAKGLLAHKCSPFSRHLKPVAGLKDAVFDHPGVEAGPVDEGVVGKRTTGIPAATKRGAPPDRGGLRPGGLEDNENYFWR